MHKDVNISKSVLKKAKKFGLIDSKSKKLDKDFQIIVDMLSEGQTLPERYKDHKLKPDGRFPQDSRECHVKGDKLIVYVINANSIEILRLGTHEQLFGSEKFTSRN